MANKRVIYDTTEIKSMKEWCVTCVFNVINKKGYVSGKKLPKESDCIQCLYEQVYNKETTEPSFWRSQYKTEQKKKKKK